VETQVVAINIVSGRLGTIALKTIGESIASGDAQGFEAEKKGRPVVGLPFKIKALEKLLAVPGANESVVIVVVCRCQRAGS